jgi:hypothetical protein
MNGAEPAGVDGAEASRHLEVLVSKDIHRLVGVTACNPMILQRSPGRWPHPSNPGPSLCDGPGLEIGPQLAPGPVRPTQSADRSMARVGGTGKTAGKLIERST